MDHGETYATVWMGQPTGNVEGFDLTPQESQEEGSQQPWRRCRWHRSYGRSQGCRPATMLRSRRARDDKKTFGWGGEEKAGGVSQSGSGSGSR
ncbi:hypothetical protein DHEL01_v208134 [Diaporthe helianthi]|uniref:Uncharacterized protein n=1 Tax=Diaporthe helianthi TaxID=158607 RepID=A0A2P5HT79_DIAHE|nr:hypothetical protein DHEL01_v208134 [Diaporthe helianthi]